MKEQSRDHCAPPLSRRDFIRLGGALGGASLLAACGGIRDQGSQRVPTPVPAPRGAPGTSAPALPAPSALQAGTAASANHGEGVAMRIAHITDMHVEPGGPGVKGFRRALRHVHALSPAVDFILNTGDCVMDSLEADKDRAGNQWEAFTSVLTEECSLPIYHAIGNHDVWGWGLPSRAQAEASKDPDFGKGLALAQLGIPQRYYGFDHSGWRFLVLDSTHLPDLASGKPYTGKLDDEQYDWLVRQLESAPASTPVCVVSHIPILAACEYLDGENETSGNWIVPGAWVHIDARRLWRLFWQHPNVGLCLSGHTHQVEDLRYHGVQYLTNGAISANWWNGSYFDFPPGYVVLTLYQDGTTQSEFVTY